MNRNKKALEDIKTQQKQKGEWIKAEVDRLTKSIEQNVFQMKDLERKIKHSDALIPIWTAKRNIVKGIQLKSFKPVNTLESNKEFCHLLKEEMLLNLAVSIEQAEINSKEGIRKINELDEQNSKIKDKLVELSGL